MKSKRRTPHPSVDPLERLRIIIGLVHGGLTGGWEPDSAKLRKKRDAYAAEAREAYRLTHRRSLDPAEMQAIEDRMEAIARWRNRLHRKGI